MTQDRSATLRSLVLGGSSFVGRTLVDRLLEAGHQVSVLNRGRSAEPPAGVRAIVADRKDSAAMRAALSNRKPGTQEWDHVFDVSGFVKTTTAEAFGDLVTTLDGRVGSYVYVSSIMAYQPSDDLPWPESHPLRSESADRYGGFKVHAESTLFAAYEQRGFPAVVARPAAIYGPRNNIYDMEAAMFLRLRKGLPVLLPHSGTVTTSYGHVDDLCTALLLMGEHPAAQGEAFNITGEAVSAAEYVRELAELVGAESDVLHLSDDIVDRLTGPAFSHLFHRRHHGTLDTGKAASVLGFRPRWTFRTGHAQTYEWFCAELLPTLTDALSDPLWGAGFDLAYEAAVAEQARRKR